MRRRRLFFHLSNQIIHGGAPGVTYIINDTFTTNRAAGSVDGTAAEPGPGTRTVVDTNNYLSISGSKLTKSAASPPSAGDPRLVYGSTSRSRGLMLRANLQETTGNRFSTVGFGNTSSIAAPNTFDGGFGRDGLSVYSKFRLGGGSKAIEVAVATSTIAEQAIFMRDAGFFHFAKIDGDWLLCYENRLNNSATLYPGFAAHNFDNQAKTLDDFAVSESAWMPTPVASDGFGSTFGTTDGFGHLETSGLGAGGDGVTWTSQAGTWASSSGSTSAASLTSGIALATVSDAHADAQIAASLTRSAGEIGLVARYTDTSNYLRAFHDGTNCVLEQIISGTPSTLVTLAVTYSAGSEIRLMIDGTNARLFYNNSLVGATTSVNAALTAGVHGIYADNMTDTLDYFTIYNRGASGEYEAIDAV